MIASKDQLGFRLCRRGGIHRLRRDGGGRRLAVGDGEVGRR
jgi:hypothetical protein